MSKRMTMMMTQIKKRSLTLIELFIAMVLTAGVLSFLSYFYFQIQLFNKEMDREQQERFHMLYLENRLANILPKTLKPKDKNFHFFTSPNTGLFKSDSTSLVFSFDNCVRLDKEMSFKVIGRLYLDEDGQLVLVKWPTEKRWKEGELPTMKKEILLDEVESLRFLFFYPKVGQNESTVKTGPHEGWNVNWEREWQTLPALIKIFVKRNGRQMTFAFPLSNTQIPITYEQ